MQIAAHRGTIRNPNATGFGPIEWTPTVVMDRRRFGAVLRL
jgi:hypothetical protein